MSGLVAGESKRESICGETGNPVAEEVSDVNIDDVEDEMEEKEAGEAGGELRNVEDMIVSRKI